MSTTTSGPAPETRNARAPRAAAPAIVTRRGSGADPVQTLTRQVEAGNSQIRTIATTQAARRLNELKQRSVALLRETVDERDRSQRRSGRVDVLTTEKIERVNHAIDETSARESRELRALRAENERLNRIVARPPLDTRAVNGPGSGTHGRFRANAAQQHLRRCVMQHLRTGQEVFGGIHLRDIQARAGLSGDNGPKGGFLLHPEFDQGPVERYLQNVVAMRGLATVRQISAYEYVTAFNRAGTDAGWVGERQARPQTDEPTLAELRYPTMELYAEPAATQRMLDDAYIDIEAWLAGEVQIKFGEVEDVAFVGGSGNNQPQGFLSYDTVADTSWAAGKLGFVATGTSGDLPASNAFDKLMDVVTRLKAGYRMNATWMLNRFSVGKVRQIKDGQGRYIWEPSGKDGQPQTLLNYPLAECDAMPDFAANSFPIAFGDFRQGYLIVDRMGLNVIRDNLTNKPYVLFYTTKRVGGGIKNDEAIKLLKAA